MKARWNLMKRNQWIQCMSCSIPKVSEKFGFVGVSTWEERAKNEKKWKNIAVFNAFLGKCPHFALEILGLCSLSVCNLSGFTTTCFSIPCDKAAISFGSLLALPWLDPACIAFVFRQRVSRWFECRPWVCVVWYQNDMTMVVMMMVVMLIMIMIMMMMITWGPCPPYPPSPQAQSPLPKGKVRRCSTPVQCSRKIVSYERFFGEGERSDVVRCRPRSQSLSFSPNEFFSPLNAQLFTVTYSLITRTTLRP